MSLYIAPESLKKVIHDHLEKTSLARYANTMFTQSEQRITFEEAKALVEESCRDKTELQPAVKLPSFYHEVVYSIWFADIYHFYGPYGEIDLTKSKFLFHGPQKTDPWTLVIFDLLIG